MTTRRATRTTPANPPRVVRKMAERYGATSTWWEDNHRVFSYFPITANAQSYQRAAKRRWIYDPGVQGVIKESAKIVSVLWH